MSLLLGLTLENEKKMIELISCF